MKERSRSTLGGTSTEGFGEESMSWYTGYKANNVWNCLKHVRTHEYVDQSLVDAVD